MICSFLQYTYLQEVSYDVAIATLLPLVDNLMQEEDSAVIRQVNGPRVLIQHCPWGPQTCLACHVAYLESHALVKCTHSVARGALGEHLPPLRTIHVSSPCPKALGEQLPSLTAVLVRGAKKLDEDDMRRALNEVSRCAPLPGMNAPWIR